MKKLKIYLDTSVIGGCFDEEFAEYSNKVIGAIINGNYQGIISEITITELNDAPDDVKNKFHQIPEESLTVLFLNDEVIKLAEMYLSEKIVSINFREDALHIAFATVYNIDVLISWNFKHIVNYNRITKFNSINLREGYKSLEIRSPMELYYDSENEKI